MLWDTMKFEYFLNGNPNRTDPCEAVATEDPPLPLGDATQGWYSLSYSTNGFCRDEHKSALHMWTPHTDCLQGLGPLTLVRDKVCENAMHGATVCQVVQSPRAVRYEQGLVSGPWKRSAQLHWVGKHQNMHKVIHFGFPTIYRFEFGGCSAGFHVEVLHPSAGAFIHSRKIYRLPLRGKILNVGPRWNMSEKWGNKSKKWTRLTPCVAVCRLNTEEHRQKHCWKDLADTPKRAK